MLSAKRYVLLLERSKLKQTTLASPRPAAHSVTLESSREHCPHSRLWARTYAFRFSLIGCTVSRRTWGNFSAILAYGSARVFADSYDILSGIRSRRTVKGSREALLGPLMRVSQRRHVGPMIVDMGHSMDLEHLAVVRTQQTHVVSDLGGIAKVLWELAQEGIQYASPSTSPSCLGTITNPRDGNGGVSQEIEGDRIGDRTSKPRRLNGSGVL